MLGGVLLKQWTSMETLGSRSFPKGKKPRNSLPNVCQRVDTLLHQILSLLSWQLVLSRSFLSFSLLFSPFFVFFVGWGPFNPSKFMNVWFEPLWNSFCDLSYSIFRSSKNSFHLMTTLCNVLSFMFFTKKPFSIDVGASSWLILFIEQTRPANCFFHESFSMTMTMSKSWAHAFRSWMDIFFTKT